MKKLVNLSLVTASAILIIGCGSSSSSVDTATAYYLDSAVSGVNYKCGSQEGITGVNGEFTFEKGESCTFYLGDIKLRDMDKAFLKDGAKIVEDDIKIATLLQSLDVDGNPDNGITLTPEVVEAVSATLKEDEESKLPSTPEEIEALVALVENNVTNFEGHIVTEEAQSHLESTQTKALLAGKTFYLAYIDHDVQKIEKIVVNADATSATWTMIKGESDSGTYIIKISGKSFFTGDEEHIIKNVTDKYIEVLTKDNDGDDFNRLYYSQADAQAYLDSLDGGDEETISKFSKEELVGKVLVTFKDKDNGKPSGCLILNNDGSIHFTFKKSGELQDGDLLTADWKIQDGDLLTADWKIQDGNLRFNTDEGYQVWESISRTGNQYRYKNNWYNKDGTLYDYDTRTLQITDSCPISELVDD